MHDGPLAAPNPVARFVAAWTPLRDAAIATLDALPYPVTTGARRRAYAIASATLYLVTGSEAAARVDAAACEAGLALVRNLAHEMMTRAGSVRGRRVVGRRPFSRPPSPPATDA